MPKWRAPVAIVYPMSSNRHYGYAMQPKSSQKSPDFPVVLICTAFPYDGVRTGVKLTKLDTHYWRYVRQFVNSHVQETPRGLAGDSQGTSSSALPLPLCSPRDRHIWFQLGRHNEATQFCLELCRRNARSDEL